MPNDNIDKSTKTDPGASKHGNFMNYYQFHPAEERVRQLPPGVWRVDHPARKYAVLDIGCNAGNLSYLLHDFLEKAEGLLEVSLLGVDLDPILIERARQYNPRPDRIAFEHLDFLSEDCDGTLKRYLDSLNKTRFDVVFCFSITMWIHLNHGDNGLEKFIRKACELTETIVIEPQPWKCYANAARRLRKAKLGDFPLRKEMKYKGEPVRYIDHILTRLCDFKRDIVTANNEWGRKLLIYRRK